VGRARLYPSAGVHGQVAHEIGRTIVSGDLAEGAFLPREAELAARFGASRQAVREALKVLAAKGLVVSRRRAGTTVLPRSSWNLLDPDVIAWHPLDRVPPEFLDDLIAVRHAIEPAAAVDAARRGDAASIAAIGEALEAMRSAEKPSEVFFAADAAFHDAILLASGNVVFDRLGTVLGPLMRTSFEAHFRGIEAALVEPARIEAVVQASLDRHAAVYCAIRDRDPAGARTATEALLAYISTEIVDAGRPRDDLR
jgi:GntR family galactonate operon transcriptional repressor